MFEENHEGEPLNRVDQVARDYIQATALEDANKANAELRAEVERLKNVVEYTGEHLKSWAEKWAMAKTLLKALLEEDGVDTDDLGENMSALVELFEIEFTEEIEVVLNVTYVGTITKPKNVSLDEIASYGFDDIASSVSIEYEGDELGCLGYSYEELEEN